MAANNYWKVVVRPESPGDGPSVVEVFPFDDASDDDVKRALREATRASEHKERVLRLFPVLSLWRRFYRHGAVQFAHVPLVGRSAHADRSGIRAA